MMIVSIVLQVLIALAFLVFGGGKIARVKMHVENFQNHYHYPLWFLTLTGLIEVLGALGMIAGIWYPVIAVLAGVWLGCTMLVGIWTHLFRAHQPLNSAVPALVLCLLSVAVIVMNGSAFHTLAGAAIGVL